MILGFDPSARLSIINAAPVAMRTRHLQSSYASCLCPIAARAQPRLEWFEAVLSVTVSPVMS